MTQRDYSQGKIYKLVSKDLSHDLVYIGSTCLDLRVRLAKHKNDHKAHKEGKRTKVQSYELFERGLVDIILIENFPCKTKAELHARERHFIETLKCVNKYVPGRTDNEYYFDHRDKILMKNKEKFTCECGVIINKKERSRHFKSLKHQEFIKKSI